VGADDRFVVCHNPEAAERDRQVRERLLTALRELIDGSDRLSPTKRAELRGQISTRPGLNRFLRVTPERAAAHRHQGDHRASAASEAGSPVACCSALTGIGRPRSSRATCSSGSSSWK
jgi:hypothetical protein